MGIVALDIETESPFEEPLSGVNETDYFEWVAIGLAYADDLGAEPETAVLFRQGGWSDTYTADLFERLFDWTGERPINRILTYNGTWFDGRHLLNWAGNLDADSDGEFRARTERLFETHVDIALAAADEYADELWDDQHILSDWKAYELAGIDNDSVWYEDYDFPDAYLGGIDGPTIRGQHIGQVLGEKYVTNVATGLEATSVHRELTRLLEDYCTSDVADLIELYNRLGGPQLDETYRRAAEHIQ